jgi:hypothetical protein
MMQFRDPFRTEYEVPQSEEDILRCAASWEWRIFSGCLYKITTKGDDDEDERPDIAVPFIPNPAQRLFLAAFHHRNIILKARQLGFSTLIEILALDHALFNPDQEVVVIAHTQSAATKLYRKKVQFAYDNLPPFVRKLRPTIERNQTQMVFNNGSSIEVTSSARGGTPHFLHVSEMGKISAKFPDKAVEINTGSLQGVPLSGRIIIESTAEGQGGEFHDLSNRAQAKRESGAKLKPSDYAFHFFPWWMDPNYRLAPDGVPISPKDHEYLDRVEETMNCVLDMPQRAWYVSKRDNDFATTPDLMWREYPSTPEEAWQASVEGKYLARALSIARKEGRIGNFPLLKHRPVNTFWDLGASDSTVIWLHQEVSGRDRWCGYRESIDASYTEDVLWLESLGCVWGGHFMPHDASHKQKGIETTLSPLSQLRLMRPRWTFVEVPRVQTIQHGIDLLRNDFGTYEFDEESCKDGLAHCEAYSREWNTRLQAWADYPRHDEHSHAVDAIRQKAQAAAGNLLRNPGRAPSKRTGERRSGMVA